MKRPARIVVSTAAGVGMFFAARGIAETAPAYEHQNRAVVSCANQLGTIAVLTETVPKQCVYGEFKSVEHITRTYTPYVGYKEKTTSMEYTLPSKKDYLSDNYVTKADVDADRRGVEKLSIGLSILFGLVTYRTTRDVRPHQKSEEGEQN